jgi:hypothetical protein
MISKQPLKSFRYWSQLGCTASSRKAVLYITACDVGVSVVWRLPCDLIIVSGHLSLRRMSSVILA